MSLSTCTTACRCPRALLRVDVHVHCCPRALLRVDVHVHCCPRALLRVDFLVNYCVCHMILMYYQYGISIHDMEPMMYRRVIFHIGRILYRLRL